MYLWEFGMIHFVLIALFLRFALGVKPAFQAIGLAAVIECILQCINWMMR